MATRRTNDDRAVDAARTVRVKAPTGPVLAATMIVACAAAGVVVTATDGPGSFLSVWPWLTLVAGAAWALYWRPEVAVSDAGVRVVNVFRTIDVPWPALRGVDTKWALTLDTVWGRYRAWAAPAPGRTALRHQLRHSTTITGHPLTGADTERAARTAERRLPGSDPGGTYGRPADLPSTDSGAAAQLVNERWRRLRQAGHLGDAGDRPEVEQTAVPCRWHWELAAGAAALILLGTLGLTI